MSEFKEFLNIQKSNINNKLSEQASVIYDTGLKLEKLIDALARLDFEIELKESQLYRNMAVKYQTQKNVTPTRINHEINCHPEIIELKEKRLDYKKALGIAKLKMRTLDTLTDTIINYSHNIREESKATSLKKL